MKIVARSKFVCVSSPTYDYEIVFFTSTKVQQQVIKLPWKQFYCIIYYREGLQPNKHTKIVNAFVCARVLNVVLRLEMIFNKGADQTARMRRVVCAFVVRTTKKSFLVSML